MTRNLLICAAFDLSGGSPGEAWFDSCWPRMRDTLLLGSAGDIHEGRVLKAAIALREDKLPSREPPKVSRHLFEPGAGNYHTFVLGRIFDSDDLARKLGCAKSSSEAGIYASAFERWGEDCDWHLTGEYAAIQWWPEERRLRLARSPLRAPPLHVWREGSKLIVGSVPRTIFAAGIDPVIDQERMAEFALFFRDHPEESLFRGLSRVACGTNRSISPDSDQANRFWDIRSIPRWTPRSDEEALEAVMVAFQRAARANLADVSDPAISLSGGLDSQISASFLLESMKPDQRLRSYTSVPVAEWLPPEDHSLVYDESDRVRELAAIYPALEPTFVSAGDRTFGEGLDALLLLGSWPTYNEMNMHWVHEIYRQAGRDGARVIFNADLGDAGISFDGCAALAEWAVRGDWGRFLREIGSLQDGRSFLRKAGSLGLRPHVPAKLQDQADRFRGHYTSPFESWCPLDPRHPEVQKALERAAATGRSASIHPPSSVALAREQMIAPTVSEGAEFNQAMRLLHGVETRDLTAFRPLFELVVSLPPHYFLHDGETRWLARRIAEGRVPSSVSTSQSTGIQSADFPDRIARDAAQVRDFVVQDVPRGSAAELIDRARITAYLDRHVAGSGVGSHRWQKLVCALPRGAALARFAQHVEGFNVG